MNDISLTLTSSNVQSMAPNFIWKFILKYDNITNWFNLDRFSLPSHVKVPTVQYYNQIIRNIAKLIFAMIVRIKFNFSNLQNVNQFVLKWQAIKCCELKCEIDKIKLFVHLILFLSFIMQYSTEKK